jgi:hypothetical protein
MMALPRRQEPAVTVARRLVLLVAVGMAQRSVAVRCEEVVTRGAKVKMAAVAVAVAVAVGMRAATLTVASCLVASRCGMSPAQSLQQWT